MRQPMRCLSPTPVDDIDCDGPRTLQRRAKLKPWKSRHRDNISWFTEGAGNQRILFISTTSCAAWVGTFFIARLLRSKQYRVLHLVVPDTSFTWRRVDMMPAILHVLEKTGWRYPIPSVCEGPLRDLQLKMDVCGVNDGARVALRLLKLMSSQMRSISTVNAQSLSSDEVIRPRNVLAWLTGSNLPRTTRLVHPHRLAVSLDFSRGRKHEVPLRTCIVADREWISTKQGVANARTLGCTLHLTSQSVAYTMLEDFLQATVAMTATAR